MGGRAAAVGKGDAEAASDSTETPGGRSAGSTAGRQTTVLYVIVPQWHLTGTTGRAKLPSPHASRNAICQPSLSAPRLSSTSADMSEVVSQRQAAVMSVRRMTRLTQKPPGIGPPVGPKPGPKRLEDEEEEDEEEAEEEEEEGEEEEDEHV